MSAVCTFCIISERRWLGWMGRLTLWVKHRQEACAAKLLACLYYEKKDEILSVRQNVCIYLVPEVAKRW